jgi:biopolymer transport protein ExbB
VIFERIWFFSRLEWGGAKFMRLLRSCLSEGKPQDALALVKQKKGPIPAMLIAALTRWPRGRKAMESAMSIEGIGAQPALFRSIPILETAVTASPLVGLLGTILGMMNIFHVVAERIAHNPNADVNGITAGIGEALISTAAGIFLAVLSLMANNLFVRLADIQMERANLCAATVLLSYDETQEKP